MTIPNGVNRTPGVNTVKPDKSSKSVEILASPQRQAASLQHAQTRNISFKLNKDSNTMYVEITNEKNEVIRTIPADENDPKFIELIRQAQPGMVVNDRS